MEKIYCGSAKTINTKYGELTKVSFTEKDLETLRSNLSNGWVNCVIKEEKNKQEGKPTHYLEVDTWKPDADAPKPSDVVQQSDTDDLPF